MFSGKMQGKITYRNMATPDTLSSNVEISTGNQNQKKTIYELLDEVTEDSIVGLYDRADLIQKIKNNPDDIATNIRSEMRRRLIGTPWSYQNFSETDIWNISEKTIIEKMNLLLLSTKTLQDKLRYKAISLFSWDTFNEGTPNWKNNFKDLNSWIVKQNENDIEKYLKSPGLLRRKLQKDCFGNRIDSFAPRNSEPFLERIWMKDKDLSNEEKIACSNIFNGVGTVTTSHIQEWLKIIDRSSCTSDQKLAVKKDIIREFLPIVTPKLLVDLEVITEEQAREKVKVGLETIFWERYFDTGTPEEKQEKNNFLTWVYKRWEYIEVSIEEYLRDDNFVTKFFDASIHGRTLLTEKIEETIKDMHSERVLAQFNSIDELNNVLGWKPEKWNIYTTKDVEWWADFYIEIWNYNESTKTIEVSDGIEKHEIPLGKFYEIATQLKLKNIGKHENETDLNKILQSIDGFKEIFVEDGVIKQKIKDEHGKDKSIPIHHFVNEDGELMYFEKISGSGGDICFGKVEEEEEKEGKKKKVDWSEKKWKVSLWALSKNKQRLSVAGIINEIRENGYKPYMNPKDKPEIDHEGHMPHTHGTFWWKFMNGTSFSDMKRAFDLYTHAWEHKFEKNSKFQAAKFADTYLTKLMPPSMQYALRSEAAGAQNEAMEWVLKMLEEMNGKTARLHVRHHILLNNDAKFEEVLAGLLYISKKTGQLYPEELSDLKNSNIWFQKLAITQGYTSKSSRKWLREKCIEKSDKSASWADALTEMDLIERQLKYYEWMGFRIPPNIAPKFPGALVEGKKWNQEKWEMEVNQRSNIKQMNRYALSKLNVGEAWKAMGCIDRLHTKNWSPTELNAIPFTLLMSNMPEYMGSEFRKALHSEWTWQRASHAFKFGNEMSLVNTYRNVVWIAAKEVDRRNRQKGNITDVSGELTKIERERHHIWNESHSKDTEDDQKNWVNSIFNFWMKYGKELQPILQMSDPFISAQGEFWGDTDISLTCKAYKNWFIGTSAMQNWQVEKIYENSNVTEGNMGPDHTPFVFTNLVNGSISAINYQDGNMSNRKDSAYGKIFKPGVLWALEKLRNLGPSDVPPWMSLRTVQESIFTEYYAALMYYLRQKGTKPPEKMLWWTFWTMEYKEQNYIYDLRKRGFRVQASDFRIDAETIPAGAEVETNWEPNNLMIDWRDKDRCKEMFNEFINTSSSVTEKTGGRVKSTFDWSWYGG